MHLGIRGGNLKAFIIFILSTCSFANATTTNCQGSNGYSYFETREDQSKTLAYKQLVLMFQWRHNQRVFAEKREFYQSRPSAFGTPGAFIPGSKRITGDKSFTIQANIPTDIGTPFRVLFNCQSEN